MRAYRAWAVLGAVCCACGPVDAPPTAGPAAPDRWIAAGDPSARPLATIAAARDEREGKDFAAEARLLFRVVACAGDAELPPRIDAGVVEEHCADLVPKLQAYRLRYVGVARPFLAALAPPGAPSAVIYPFAGGDLVTALTTFPDAREITTLSLELAGDPRRVGSIGRQDLAESLAKLRGELDELISFDDYSKSETLKRGQRGDIPGELAFFLVSLAIHDQEPVGLRYFDLMPDGSLHYLSQAEIDVVEDRLAQHKKGTWWPPDFSEAFANVEIAFRPKGAGPGVAPRVHRHIAANLADDHLRVAPGVLHHLEAKGDVLAMTKAASYLLWNDGFSSVRDYLLGHMVFMVSDSTGIPPVFTTRAGFVQETYGTFRASLLRAAPATHNAAFRKLWDGQPRRKLPFRYGYRDGTGHDHLVVTKRPSPKPAGG